MAIGILLNLLWFSKQNDYENLFQLFNTIKTIQGTVPDFLPEPPAEPLYMKVKGKMVYPNTPLKTSEVS